MHLIDWMAQIPDPRESYKIRHSLSTILFTTLCGVLCGAESWSDIHDFCEIKQDWLSQYVDFKNGIPSEWTFRRLFTLIDPCFLEWLLRTHVSNVVPQVSGAPIALDGKSLRGSKRHDLRALSSLSALCHETGLVLGEVSVDGKSNETKAIPLLLEVLNLQGRTVTIDAAGCQRTIATTIKDKGGEYVFSLKKNHPKLHDEVHRFLQEQGIRPDYCLEDRFDLGHGRCVRRRYFACDARALSGADQWTGLKSVIAVERIRQGARQNTEAAWSYYLSSHPHEHKDLPSYIRGHWGIENKLHWVLDVAMKEDSDRKSERRSAKAFSTLRRIALNMVRAHPPSKKSSLRGRLKCAGWNQDYLLKVLASTPMTTT